MLAALAIWVLIGSVASAETNHIGEDLSQLNLGQLSLTQLEAKLDDVESQLKKLAKPSMRTGVGSIGFRSFPIDAEDTTEWVRIELDHETQVDQIVLVPTIWRDTKTGFRADGFPLEFRITVGARDDSDGRVIAEFGADPSRLPRVAPLIVPCHEDNVAWIQLDATKLSRRAWDGKHTLQLSEIAVFSGQENVALRQVVTSSSSGVGTDGSRRKEFLVDGSVPYLMDAEDGKQSIAYVSSIPSGIQAEFSIDLGDVHVIDRVHLHSTDVSDTVPQSLPADFGIPRNMILSGGLKADYSDAASLFEYQIEGAYDAGPIIMRSFAAARCRYVRLTVVEPYIEAGDERNARVGFAEIELYSDGTNVALNKLVSSNMESSQRKRKLRTLTDGNNFYGRVLPIRKWFGQLATRHDLETLRPLIRSELSVRYQRQATNLNRVILLATLLGVASLCVVLVGWVMTQRAVLRTRERIAADLHDEVGANLHAIGLLSDLAQNAAGSPSQLEPLMVRIRELTERTGTAAAYCANLLESEGLYDDLAAEMRRSSDRIMSDLQYEITFEGEEFLRLLKPQKRIDLFLFYKESLVNIIRHSGATKAGTCVSADGRQLRLAITDNGCGVMCSQGAEKTRNGVPPSLKRRARLLGARVFVTQPDGGGTEVTLEMRMNRFGKASNDRVTRVTLIEDNADYRAALQLAFAQCIDIELTSQFGTSEIAVRSLKEADENELPDLILLDLRLPGMDGLDSIPVLRQCVPNAKIVVLTQSNQEKDVLRAISLGASGYLLKKATFEEMTSSIRSVLAGGAALDASVASFVLTSLQARLPSNENEGVLSHRELEILTLLADGMVKKEIAKQLGIGYSTVDTHVGRIYAKLSVNNAPAAINKAHKMRILPSDE